MVMAEPWAGDADLEDPAEHTVWSGSAALQGDRVEVKGEFQLHCRFRRRSPLTLPLSLRQEHTGMTGDDAGCSQCRHLVIVWSQIRDRSVVT